MQRTEELEERFWSKVNWSKDDSVCWPWTAGTDGKNGYGKFRIGPGSKIYAHRVAYELEIGPIPDGLEIDHTCRNTSCCNPGHLEPVTHQENIKRARAARTHCPYGHAYEGDNLLMVQGRRSCRACRARRSREFRARRKAAK